MITFVIPSHNNLQHLKNVYASILKHASSAEIILLDDGSTDSTWEWIWQLAESHQHREVKAYKSKERVGHTILYDVGIKMSTNQIVGILHADMIIGPNYVENMIKHLKPGKVVCATRVEPPLHPAGKEKIIKDFGMDFDSLNLVAFDQFVERQQKEDIDKTTRGMFAPWILYKTDFVSIGGHDPLFEPFPLEDSDIFQRWVLNGYELIQSRDALVYHLTCRGHRWTGEVGKDDEYFKLANAKASKNYLRKWGSWIRNDEFHHPILPPVYDIGYRIKNSNYKLIELLEPWCSTIAVDGEWAAVKEYIIREQSQTNFDLEKRFKPYGNLHLLQNDIVVEFDGNQLTQNSFNILQNLSYIIQDSGATGTFELDVFKITINRINERSSELVDVNNPSYQRRLI